MRLLRRLWPVTEWYAGTRLTVREAATALAGAHPVALVVAIPARTFAIDSVPAVYGITGDPYLVFAHERLRPARPARALLRAHGALGALRHLGFGLAAILAFIGVKLVLHWAHGVWTWVPEVPTLPSLGVIVGILALVTATSLCRRRAAVTTRGSGSAEAERGVG